MTAKSKKSVDSLGQRCGLSRWLIAGRHDEEQFMSMTIGETIQELHSALRDYIEATYHVSNPTLVAQRRALLEQLGVIYQKPYLESTPRYKTATPFSALGLDSAALELFSDVSKPQG